MKNLKNSIFLQYSILLLVLSLSLVSCGKVSFDDTDEVAQMAGDVASGVDESAGNNSGTTAFLLQPIEHERMFSISDWIEPRAEAVGCWASSTFSSCSASIITRSFSGCTMGAHLFNGSVTLTWANTATAGACALDQVGATLTRNPNYTITGPRGNTLTVTGDAGGHRLTKLAPHQFALTILGMKRVLTKSDGSEIFNISTKTNSDITVTGTSRVDRVMNGGELEITHNIAGYTTVLQPVNLTWSSTCNCPVSGSWNGQVKKDGTQKDFMITLTGCGTATVAVDGGSSDISFDRCVGI